ncbi:MAG: 50S ribosomal protein L6 [Candidatus Diapherotrites archaeon]|nr:50S ribosomal protein L6 [Candidatus Diapherotrites archaeon]
MAVDIREEIPIEDGVQVSVEGDTVKVKGPKGSLERNFDLRNIHVATEGNNVIVYSEFPKRQQKAMVGTIASHIKNMIHGAKEGFAYRLQVVYAHFPVNLGVQGNKVIIKNFMGEKHPRESQIAGNVKVDIQGQNITVTGANKEDVAQTSANLVEATRIKRRDPRVFKDGIYIIGKE